ncbi:MAG TPA: complex I NDUFA9 subunit family protein [Stellaceae bacterium]|nr:complex I NDUFA9 subunit family protein [Stellaceae bacterium]
MRNRRVCVVGGSGFIGRYIVKRLAERGAVVSVVSRHASEARFLKPMGDVGQIALIDAGLADEAALAAALEGASAVVSSVGILYERGRQRFQLLHVDGPARVARLAAAAGARHFVHVSALSADARAASAYARSKAEGEAAVKAAFPAATILRPSLVFGPEDDFFNRFGALARVAPALPLVGGGGTRFQPVYVGDVADAVMATLERPEAEGKTYELGGPAVLSFRQLMELLLAEIGRRRLLVPMPFGLASLMAFFMGMMPRPMLTRDQVKLLRRDSVATPGAPGLADLGITPTALALVLPTYLNRFRPGGRAALHAIV